MSINGGYTDIHGNFWHMDDDVTNDLAESEKLQKVYIEKAILLSAQTEKDVFFCVKNTSLKGFYQAFFFLIPIERHEIDTIADRFQKYGYIGIVYSDSDGVVLMRKKLKCEGKSG